MNRRCFLLLLGLWVTGGILDQALGAVLRSGITGVAVAGPISPVERPGVPNTAPLGFAIITVRRANGSTEIARTVANEQGQFRIALAPGKYWIVPLPPDPAARFPRGTSQLVTVRNSRLTDVIVHYDTGIR